MCRFCELSDDKSYDDLGLMDEIIQMMVLVHHKKQFNTLLNWQSLYTINLKKD